MYLVYIYVLSSYLHTYVKLCKSNISWTTLWQFKEGKFTILHRQFQKNKTNRFAEKNVKNKTISSISVVTCHKLKNHNCPQIDDTCHILNKEPQGVSSTKPQPPCCHSLPRSFLPSRWVAQVDLRFTMRWSSGCGCVAGLMFIEATWYIYIYI